MWYEVPGGETFRRTTQWIMNLSFVRKSTRIIPELVGIVERWSVGKRGVPEVDSLRRYRVLRVRENGGEERGRLSKRRCVELIWGRRLNTGQHRRAQLIHLLHTGSIKAISTQTKGAFTQCMAPDGSGQCRTVSSGATLTEHIDLTALFAYRTMSYVAATALPQ